MHLLRLILCTLRTVVDVAKIFRNKSRRDSALGVSLLNFQTNGWKFKKNTISVGDRFLAEKTINDAVVQKKKKIDKNKYLYGIMM